MAWTKRSSQIFFWRNCIIFSQLAFAELTFVSFPFGILNEKNGIPSELRNGFSNRYDENTHTHTQNPPIQSDPLQIAIQSRQFIILHIFDIENWTFVGVCLSTIFHNYLTEILSFVRNCAQLPRVPHKCRKWCREHHQSIRFNR